MEFELEEKNDYLKLSNQALGAVMMALQESLLNEMDIVPILKGFELTTEWSNSNSTFPFLPSREKVIRC